MAEEEDDGADQRVRYQGAPDQFAAALDGVVTSPAFVKYDEVKLVAQAKVVPELIVAAYPLLSALHGLQPNLAFTRRTVMLGLGIILRERTERSKAWAMPA
eukprot:7034600-Alexandrium_andersonii.AAC.1